MPPRLGKYPLPPLSNLGGYTSPRRKFACPLFLDDMSACLGVKPHRLDLKAGVILPPRKGHAPLGTACRLQAHDRVPGNHFGVLIINKFCLRQYCQTYPHLRQSSGRLFQSLPPPVNDIPCCHPKCPATLLARGRRISVSGRHHACAIPTAKNKSSSSRVVTTHTSGPLQHP
jgi:hypothetical protein